MYTQKLGDSTFQKRADLTMQKRVLIVYLVFFQWRHGLITKLANKYNVSRTFIYDLCENYSFLKKDDFACHHVVDKQTKHLNSLKAVLKIRLEGKCSIESVRDVMQYFALDYCSVGFISTALHKIGTQLSNNKSVNKESSIKYVVNFCDDEIFAQKKPILITVEPLSLMILSIELATNCQGVTWKKHWDELMANGYIPLYITKDQGVGMDNAHSELFGTAPWQSDTFHGVPYKLGFYRKRFLQRAYTAIGQEYKCEHELNNAKTETQLTELTTNYLISKKDATQAIEVYENFCFLYPCLLKSFRLFDRWGLFRGHQSMTGEFDAALELMKTLQDNDLNADIKSIEKNKDNLFYFTQVAQKIVGDLAKTTDSITLQLLCKAWQNRKQSIKIKHNPTLKKSLLNKEKELLLQVQELEGHTWQQIKDKVYDQLNHIIQSSAAVECINSVLRPYLNTCKGQVTTEFLNLFMFYHNHRRFAAGQRKGKTPFELFTGQAQQKDWLDLLLETVSV